MEKRVLNKENRNEVIAYVEDRIKKNDCNTIYIECGGKEWAIRIEYRIENEWKTKDIVCRAKNDINDVLYIEEGSAHRLPKVNKAVEKIFDLMEAKANVERIEKTYQRDQVIYGKNEPAFMRIGRMTTVGEDDLKELAKELANEEDWENKDMDANPAIRMEKKCGYHLSTFYAYFNTSYHHIDIVANGGNNPGDIIASVYIEDMEDEYEIFNGLQTLVLEMIDYAEENEEADEKILYELAEEINYRGNVYQDNTSYIKDEIGWNPLNLTEDDLNEVASKANVKNVKYHFDCNKDSWAFEWEDE